MSHPKLDSPPVATSSPPPLHPHTPTHVVSQYSDNSTSHSSAHTHTRRANHAIHYVTRGESSVGSAVNKRDAAASSNALPSSPMPAIPAPSMTPRIASRSQSLVTQQQMQQQQHQSQSDQMKRPRQHRAHLSYRSPWSCDTQNLRSIILSPKDSNVNHANSSGGSGAARASSLNPQVTPPQASDRASPRLVHNLSKRVLYTPDMTPGASNMTGAAGISGKVRHSNQQQEQHQHPHESKKDPDSLVHSSSSFHFQSLQPPPQFSIIEPQPGLYRCAQFEEHHVGFLETLGLRSVVWIDHPLLHPLPSPNPMHAWCNDRNIQFFDAGAEAWSHVSPSAVEAFSNAPHDFDLSTSSSSVSQPVWEWTMTLVRLSLEHLLQAMHAPSLIVCHNGLEMCSLVVGCLRRLEGWSLTSAMEEVARFNICLRLLEEGRREDETMGGHGASTSKPDPVTVAVAAAVAGSGGMPGPVPLAPLRFVGGAGTGAPSNLASDLQRLYRLEELVELFEPDMIQLPHIRSSSKRKTKKKRIPPPRIPDICMGPDCQKDEEKEAEASTSRGNLDHPSSPVDASTGQPSDHHHSTDTTTATLIEHRCVAWFERAYIAQRREARRQDRARQMRRAERRKPKAQMKSDGTPARTHDAQSAPRFPSSSAPTPITTTLAAVPGPVPVPTPDSSLYAWDADLWMTFHSNLLLTPGLTYDKKKSLVDEEED